MHGETLKYISIGCSRTEMSRKEQSFLDLLNSVQSDVISTPVAHVLLSKWSTVWLNVRIYELVSKVLLTAK